jgi:hypothetical protein
MRKPLLSNDHVEYRSQTPSPLAERLPGAFRDAFAERILPAPTTVGSFSAAEAPLYVNERLSHDAGGHETLKPQAFEAILDEMFWHEEKPPLLFIEGMVGSGKSTFVEYYLRCYCPHTGIRAKDFSAKLILLIDFRSTPSAQEFDKRLFKIARTQILAACAKVSFKLEVENCYSFWKPIFDFDSDTFRAAQGDQDVEAFRRNYVHTHKPSVSDEDWVHAALHYLSQQQGTSFPYKYIVLCLDNLDQSDPDVIQHAIYRIREWTELRDNIRLWRVIIPVRPNTLSLILDEVKPLPRYDVMALSPPDLNRLLELRNEVLRTAIAGINNHDSPNEPDVEENATIMQSFLTNCRSWASPRFHEFLWNISGGSSRQILELWQGIMSSKSLYNNYKVKVNDPATSQSLGHYFLMNGMLTAQYRVYHPEKHSILNVFNLIDESRSERDLLIGIHVLALLKNGVTDYDQLLVSLERLGYGLYPIEEVLRRFKSRYVFRLLKKRIIQPERQIINAYWSLLAEPAYIEQVAYVTPLDSDPSPAGQVDTKSDDDEFLVRCNSAFRFLAQLQRDEKRFCKVDARPPVTNKDEFLEELKRARIPSVSNNCISRYEDRLRYLHSQGWYATLTSLAWERLLRHPIFEIKARLPALLQPVP